MMIIDEFDIVLALNYDTNGRQVFTFEERLELHRSRSHKLYFGKDLPLTEATYIKTRKVLAEIKEVQYVYVDKRYYEDSEGRKILK